MIIQSSAVNLSSARSYNRKSTQIQALNTWGGSSSVKNGGGSQFSSGSLSFSNSGGQSSGFNSLLQDLHGSPARKIVSANRQKSSQERSIEKIKFQSINFLLQLLFGKNSTGQALSVNTTDSSSADSFLGSAQQFGGEYFSSSEFFEQETTCFSTTGTVVTADGTQISFGLNLEMSRSFYSYTSEHVQFGAQLCDPLVINLDDNPAQVSDQTFLFDLDADGTMDRVSSLSGKRGFLALDKNGDGKINDGSELFGTQSGDGFYDLSEYDLDKNGWIDEADDIFDSLVIWTKNDQGKDALCSLKDAGIGAIYLGNTSTEFSMNNAATNETNGVIRKSGVFLYEKGTAGTIQHVDLAKKEYHY